MILDVIILTILIILVLIVSYVAIKIKKQKYILKHMLITHENALNFHKKLTLKIDKNKDIFENMLNDIYQNQQAISIDQKNAFPFIREVYYSQLFQDSIRNISWLKDCNFSLSGGAANYSFMYFIYLVLENTSPQKILEFGLGQSTKLTSNYVKNHDNSFLDIIDHDKDWISHYNYQNQESKNIRLHHLDLTYFDYNGCKNTKYKDLDKILDDNKYNLILVDGPIGMDMNFPRSNIIDIIPNNLAQQFVIIIDDYERVGEHHMTKALIKKLEDNKIDYKKFARRGIKHQLIITSPNFFFLYGF